MSITKLSSLTVLVVDDVRATRAIIRLTLRNFGIDRVLEASDGQAAFEVLRGNRVDLVITDMCMDPMDGIEFTRKLRLPNSSPDPFVPVLMVSGHTEVSRVRDALGAGVTAFLAKPVTSASLQKKLIAIVNAPPKLVQTDTYCGPDRRRSSVKSRKRRRASDLTTTNI